MLYHILANVRNATGKLRRFLRKQIGQPSTGFPADMVQVDQVTPGLQGMPVVVAQVLNKDRHKDRQENSGFRGTILAALAALLKNHEMNWIIWADILS